MKPTQVTLPSKQERPGEQFVSRIALRKAQASLRKPELGSTSDEEESGAFAFEEERGGEGDENERPPPPRTSIFEQIESVWVHHRISVVCLQTFIFAVCFQMQRPVEPFLLEMLGFSNELYAVLQAFTCFLQALSIPVVELCRLKCGNRTTLIVCSAATMLSYVLLARATNSWVLYLSRVIGGVQPGFAFSKTIIVCMTPPGVDRTAALLKLASAYTMGTILGPAFGGYMAVHEGYFYCAGLATYAALAGLLLAIVTPLPGYGDDASAGRTRGRYRANEFHGSDEELENSSSDDDVMFPESPESSSSFPSDESPSPLLSVDSSAEKARSRRRTVAKAPRPVALQTNANATAKTKTKTKTKKELFIVQVYLKLKSIVLKPMSSMRAGLIVFAGNTLVHLILKSIMFLSDSFYQSTAPITLRDTFHLEVSDMGMAMSSLALVTWIFAQYFVSPLGKHLTQNQIIIRSLVMHVLMFLFKVVAVPGGWFVGQFAPHLALWLVPTMACANAGHVFSVMLRRETTAKLYDEQQRTTYIHVERICFLLIRVLGPPIAVHCMSVYGVASVDAICGLLCAVCLGWWRFFGEIEAGSDWGLTDWLRALWAELVVTTDTTD